MNTLTRSIILTLLGFVSLKTPSYSQIESFYSLTPTAEVITIANVLSVQTHWNQECTQIHTTILLLPTEVLKGNLPQATIQLTILGGRMPNVRMLVSDSPTFKKGESVLLLLHPKTDGTYALTGYGDGKVGFREKEVEFHSRLFPEDGLKRFINLLRSERRG